MTARAGRAESGFTMVELMISLGMLVLLSIGAAKSYEAVITLQTKTAPARELAEVKSRFEKLITDMIRSAYLSPGGGGAATYFTGFVNTGGISAGGIQADQPSDTLTFTAASLRPIGSYLESTDDFPTLNTRYGPQGGLAEVSLSMVAVGDAGSRTGPYLREQRPADGDFTQGGFESVLDPDVTTISFQFYDGTAWVGEWDTSTMPDPRLPAAVKVTYRRSDEDFDRTLTVRIPLSDVTPENPAGVGLGGTQ